MLQCPKCGTDNLLNAIFCRGCGERLELENLKPESFQDNKATKAQKITRIVNIVLGIVLTVLIVVVVAGALFPVSGRIQSVEPSDEVTKNYNTLLKRGKKRSLTFSNEEATALVNHHFKTFAGTSGIPTPESVTVLFLGDGNVKLILSAKLKFLNLHTTVIATPTFSSPNDLSLVVQSAKLGFLPLPAPLQPKLINNFKTIASSNLDRARKRISAVTVLDGSATIERVGK
ncbi:MAG: zinc ribbon domain-containing protein [Lentisphaeria bacterium]